jgi:hypothetical protein
MINFADFLLGLVGGFIVGYLLEHKRFKHSLKIEKIKRLSPHLESAFPILEKLDQDSDYATRIQQRDDENEFNRITDRLCSEMEEFYAWYLQFQEDGLKPELQSVNRLLCAYLDGMFVFAKMSIRYRESYISQKTKEISDLSNKCKRELELQLMG